MDNEKRMAGDYEIIQAIMIGDREIVIGENQADTNGQKYMTAVGEWNDLFEHYDNVLVSDDYPEIVSLFGHRVTEQANKTRDELCRPTPASAARLSGRWRPLTRWVSARSGRASKP